MTQENTRVPCGSPVQHDRVTAMLTAFALGCALIVLAGLYSGGEI